MKTPHVLVIAAILALSASSNLHAQAVYGSIVGTVLDATGAAMPGVTVTIRNTERDVANVTTTNESGNYSQRYLIAGRYQIRVEAPGFKTFVQDNVGVSVDTDARVDYAFQLALGRGASAVERSRLKKYLDEQPAAGAWTGAARVLFNIDEFIVRE